MSVAHPRQRITEGKRQREAASRDSQGNLNAKNRAFDPLAVLRAAEGGRVRQLLPIKYARMSVSPFAFFRGAVAIMAADLAALPHSGIFVQLCGDAHVQNLGSFAAPDGRLVFDLNDFDETIRGPWEWDVKRLAASLILAGRESGHNKSASRAAVETFASAYSRSVHEFSELPVLQVARHQVHRSESVAPVHAALLQSRRASAPELLERFTTPDRHGVPRFRDSRPQFWRIRGTISHAVLESLQEYRESLAPERRHFFDLFRPVDVGFKVVGTGSVGLRDYVVLLEGNGSRDPMFLQIKQEVRSAYVSYLPDAHKNQGRRVAEGQRAVQPMSDLMLGWTRIGEHDYLVRQLNDHKGSIDLQKLRGGGLKSLALLAGELLARGHARSGDACQVRGYCGEGEKIVHAIARFAEAYADQTEADFAAFTAAIKRGKIRIGGK